MHFTAAALDFFKNEAREGYILSGCNLSAAYAYAALRAKERFIQRDGVFDLSSLSPAAEYLSQHARRSPERSSLPNVALPDPPVATRVAISDDAEGSRGASLSPATDSELSPVSTVRASQSALATESAEVLAPDRYSHPLTQTSDTVGEVSTSNAGAVDDDLGQFEETDIHVVPPASSAGRKAGGLSNEIGAEPGNDRLARAEGRQPPRYSYSQENQPPPYEELPDVIDYQNRPGSRPVLVIALGGAFDGGASPSLGELTRQLNGRYYRSNSDQEVQQALRQINDFQRSHPNGIVVVLAYSHNGWTFKQSIAGRTRRPIDIAVFFDPYERGWFSGGGADMELPGGSVCKGYNFYQKNKTTGLLDMGPNTFQGSRILNPEFENIDLTSKAAQESQNPVTHSSIVKVVMESKEHGPRLSQALRR